MLCVISLAWNEVFSEDSAKCGGLEMGHQIYCWQCQTKSTVHDEADFWNITTSDNPYSSWKAEIIWSISFKGTSGITQTSGRMLVFPFLN